MDGFFDVAIMLLIKGGLNFLWGSALYRILSETRDAVHRVRKKPKMINKETLRLVIAHQFALALILTAVASLTVWNQPPGVVDWPAALVGVVYLFIIRRVAMIDTRIYLYRKEQKAAHKAANHTLTTESGAE